jgi:ABC-type multidrug transport system fused ATPase/permease subunit
MHNLRLVLRVQDRLILETMTKNFSDRTVVIIAHRLDTIVHWFAFAASRVMMTD